MFCKLICKDMGEPVEVASHVLCARRETNVRDSSSAIAHNLQNVTLLTHDHESECCGFGGTFSVNIWIFPLRWSAINRRPQSHRRFASGERRLRLLAEINGVLEKQASSLRGKNCRLHSDSHHPDTR